MSNGYFEYPVPFADRLKEMYGSMFDFSPEIKQVVFEIFSSPKNRMRREFAKMEMWDTRDMLKAGWRVWQYYIDHPQQFGHNAENIVDQLIVNMVRAFISIHKKARKTLSDKYYAAHIKAAKPLVIARLLPLLAKEEPIKENPGDAKRGKRKPIHKQKLWRQASLIEQEEFIGGTGGFELENIRW